MNSSNRALSRAKQHLKLSQYMPLIALSQSPSADSRYSEQSDGEEFWLLVDSSKFLVTTGRNQISFFIVSLFIIIQIWLKSQISLSAFPASALQCRQPQRQTIFVRNRSINRKSDQYLWFSASLDICLTIKAKVLLLNLYWTWDQSVHNFVATVIFEDISMNTASKYVQVMLQMLAIHDKNFSKRVNGNIWNNNLYLACCPFQNHRHHILHILFFFVTVINHRDPLA